MTTPVANVPVSTVPKVLAYLFTKLTANVTAQDATTSVLVAYMEPPAGYRPLDLVVVGGAKQRTMKPTQLVGSGGAGFIFETYTVDITVECFRGGQGFQPMVERAWALESQVEAVIRSDLSLGGLVITAHPVATKESTGFEEEGSGISTLIELSVDVEAQI